MVLRIGILGAARIAPPALIQPARAIGGVEAVAVGASDAARAAAFAAEHGLSAFGTREDLLARNDLDMIYVALPPSDHAAWSIRALQTGKHVLCEKPFAMSAAETEAVQAAAAGAGKRVIEATHYRYHPLMARVVDDAVVDVAHVHFLPFQQLQKDAVAKEQHAGHASPRIAHLGGLQNEFELVLGHAAAGR